MIRERIMPLAWLLAAMLIIGGAAGAKANAQPDDPIVVIYAAHNAGAVCETLSAYPSFSGIEGIADAIVEQGLTYSQAGSVIFLSVTEACPRFTGLLLRYATAYGPRPSQVGAVA